MRTVPNAKKIDKLFSDTINKSLEKVSILGAI